MKAFPKLFKKFLRFTTNIVHQSDTTDYEICPPSHIHGMRSVGVSKKNRQIKSISDFEGRGYYEGYSNDSRLYLPQQPITTNLEKVLNSFHNIIVFYRSFWTVNQSGKEPTEISAKLVPFND